MLPSSLPLAVSLARGAVYMRLLSPFVPEMPCLSTALFLLELLSESLYRIPHASPHASRQEAFRDQVPGHRLMRRKGGGARAPTSGEKSATFQDFSSPKLCSEPTYASMGGREEGVVGRGFRVFRSIRGAGYKRGASNYL